ncbi:MAG: hypothetical protein ACR2MN_05675 [Acidimicrobiales bacterium]
MTVQGCRRRMAMAGAVVVVGASMAACGGSSATSAKDFCTNLNNASKTISGDLGGNAPPKATLQKDAKTLNDLAGSAPQQLKRVRRSRSELRGDWEGTVCVSGLVGAL